MRDHGFYHEIAREFIGPFLDAGSELEIIPGRNDVFRIVGSKRFETVEADLLCLDHFPWLARRRQRRRRQIIESLPNFLSGPRFGDLESLLSKIASEPKGYLAGAGLRLMRGYAAAR